MKKLIALVSTNGKSPEEIYEQLINALKDKLKNQPKNFIDKSKESTG